MERALELDPMSSILHTDLADVLVNLGRYENAEQQLIKLLELDPGFAPAYSMMANLMGETGRMDEQVLWIQKSMEMDPGRVTLNLQLLWAYMDLEYTEPMLEIRGKMAAVNPDHLFTGFVDMLTAMYSGNLDAALESAEWANQRMGRPVWFQRIFGFLNNMAGEFATARAHFEVSDPNFFKRDTWEKGLENDAGMGCMVGWILLKTGDEVLGSNLIETTEKHLVKKLPTYIDHADRYAVDQCYVVRGELDQALDEIETWVSHKHYRQWFFIRMHPQYEPLWGHPRFEAAMQQIEDDMAAQRTRLAQMKEAAGP